MINKCDYCRKISFNKNYLKQHEKKCFYNPATQSCATCLWFGRVHNLNETTCFLGKFEKAEEGVRQKLKTACKSWRSAEIVEECDLFENDNLILKRLYAGDKKFFNALSKSNQVSMEDKKLDSIGFIITEEVYF